VDSSVELRCRHSLLVRYIMMEKKYCVQCSQSLIPTMQFCPKCGGRSFASQPVPSASLTPTAPAQNSFMKQTNTPNAQWQQSSGRSQPYGKAMSPHTAIGNCLRNYFTIRGRAPRSEYWWFTAVTVLASFLTSFLAGLSDTASLLALSVQLGSIIPIITVAVRRLHDIDRSGWWYLILFIPLVGFVLLLVWFCARGTNGGNRFGPDPLADSSNVIVTAKII